MRMNLSELPEYAKSIDRYDNLEFTAFFPHGAVKCKMLDAYFGMFLAEGVDGFLVVRRVCETFTIECEVSE